MKRLFSGWAAALLLFIPISAFAHHGRDMFDQRQTITLKGVVKEFQWTNPHAWIQLNVEDKGTTTEWSLEGNSISILYRFGWKRTSIKPGDHISVDIHPLRNGTPGGQWLRVVDVDGKTLAGGPEGLPPGGRGGPEGAPPPGGPPPNR